MKIGFISDTHTNTSKGMGFKFTEDTFDYFEKLCNQLKVDVAFHLGDLFDAKTHTATEGLIKISNKVKNIAKNRKFYIIRGNHDTALTSNPEFNLPNVFSGYNNVQVISNPYVSFLDEYLIYVIPHSENIKEELFNLLEQSKKIKGKDIFLFGHFGVQDFYMNDKKVDENSLLTPHDLKIFKRVFLGHYHGYQYYNNIMYVSSPLQLKMGDNDAEHGFVFYDTDKDEVEFISNPYTPKYIKTTLNQSFIKQINSYENCYFELYVNKKTDASKLIKIRDKLMKKNLGVEFINNFQTNNEIIVVDGWSEFIKQDSESFVSEFIDTQKKIIKENNWDKKELLKLILEE